ncbi:MAG: YqaA family protein [Rhodovarius sp.]|nr:DedA family protein [Rhodovarius sp.]MCX7931449.1 DedA family protein [Rhodovarius sp.]MDW8314537.1 YqaA family protein [Rhodovarius sp.]
MDFAAYLGLFLSAFGAATLLPLQSEPVLIGLLAGGVGLPWLLVATASLGNTLGAVVNWWLGRQIDRFRDRRWFPVPPDRLEAARRWYARWGRWSLLLSWAPFVGDPLTVIAGAMRERLAIFLLLVGLAKTGRYLVLAWVTLGLL